MPTIHQAFEQFEGAVVFSFLDLKSEYNQIPLSVRSRRTTAFSISAFVPGSVQGRWPSGKVDIALRPFQVSGTVYPRH